MHSASPSRLILALAPGAMLIATAGATAGPPVMISIKVGNTAEVTVPQKAEPSPTGNFQFVGEANDPAGLWTAAWNFTADLDPRGSALVTGSIKLTNEGSNDAACSLRLAFPLDPVISKAARVGGLASVQIAAEELGGKLTTSAGQGAWALMADDEIASQLFYSPFSLTADDHGTAKANATFGMPLPAQPCPGIDDVLQVRHLFTLSPRCTATFNSYVTVEGDAINFVAQPLAADEAILAAAAGTRAEANRLRQPAIIIRSVITGDSYNRPKKKAPTKQATKRKTPPKKKRGS